MIYLVGTSDTKAAEIEYLRALLANAPVKLRCVDVGIRGPGCEMDVTSDVVARCHPDGSETVLASGDRGTSVGAMAQAFAQYCVTQKDHITAMIGIGGGGGTSIITAGMRALPYGVPKVMVSTLASGDVAPYVGTSDLIMMPSVTDIAGLNQISRHILHNAAHSILGMAAHPYVATHNDRPSVGLSMFGVTTPCVTQITEQLGDAVESVVFHATGTGGRSMEQLLDQGMLSGLIDITTTEIADHLVGGVLSAGAERLDAVIASGAPYVGSVGALDMVNFWAPETVPAKFKDRLFYHHNANVTLMRTTAAECAEIGSWIATKLNNASGSVHLLLPEKGLSALDIEGGPFWDPTATAALYDTLERELHQTENRQITRLPYHINDPAFSAAAVATYLSVS